MIERVVRTNAPAVLVVVELEAPVRVHLPGDVDRDRMIAWLGRNAGPAAVLAAALAELDRARADDWSRDLSGQEGGVHALVERLVMDLFDVRERLRRAEGPGAVRRALRRLPRGGVMRGR